VGWGAVEEVHMTGGKCERAQINGRTGELVQIWPMKSAFYNFAPYDDRAVTAMPRRGSRYTPRLDSCSFSAAWIMFMVQPDLGYYVPDRLRGELDRVVWSTPSCSYT
jgi:hypothetical protein